MNKMDMLCSSQTATAIYENSPPSTPSFSTFLLPTAACGARGAAIDRHNPILRDHKRIPKPSNNHSDPPTLPKHQKIRDGNNNSRVPLLKGNGDDKLAGGGTVFNGRTAKKGWKCTNPGDFISPPGSTRYLLREKGGFGALSSEKPPSEEFRTDWKKLEQFSFAEKLPSPVPRAREQLQVVVLRVSLHCRGCERKLRKHLSTMEDIIVHLDGSAQRNSEPTGYGICTRSSPGQWIVGVSAYIGVHNNFTAELHGILNGLRLIEEQDWNFEVILFSDSFEVVLLVTNSNSDHSVRLKLIIEKVHSLPHVSIACIYREGNTVIDGLARRGSSNELFYTMWAFPPDDSIMFVVADAARTIFMCL